MGVPMDVPWTASASGVTLHVRLTPKGGRDSIDGIEKLSDGRSVLKARVRAVPADGEANTALTILIAKALDIPARAVSITGGATARVKRLAIDGDAASLIARLEKLTAAR
jgi:uncharacterized protein YggU (UPF0235/DUF167 family)